MKKFPWVVLVIWAALSQSAMAGVITLKNGDRLYGELVKLEAETVVWASDSFGEMTVVKDKIENLQTASLLKINGHQDACALYGMEGPDLIYSCEEAGPGRVPLAALEVALPYESYLMGAHTYRGKLALAGAYSRGNKTEDDWDLESVVEFRRGDFRNLMRLEYESKTQDDQPADEKYNVEYGLDWFFQTRWFLYNDVAVGGDETKNVDERYTFGSGFGFQVWEVDRTALALRGGITFVKELFDRPEDLVGDFESSDDRLAWELSTDYRYQLPLGAEMFHTSSLIQSFEDGEDWRFDSDTGLKIPLGAGLFSELKLAYDFENQPQAGKRREDTKVRVGIGYNW